MKRVEVLRGQSAELRRIALTFDPPVRDRFLKLAPQTDALAMEIAGNPRKPARTDRRLRTPSDFVKTPQHRGTMARIAWGVCIAALSIGIAAAQTPMDNRANGRGTVRYANGVQYQGELRESRPNGYGIMTFRDGDRYEGNFRDGRFHGRGIFTFARGGYYDGEFRDGLRAGHGVAMWADGTQYEGAWSKSRIEGLGVKVWSNGARYDGEWHNGKPQGQGTMRFPDGRTISGLWAREGDVSAPARLW